MLIADTESFELASDHVGDAFQISVAMPPVIEANPLTTSPPMVAYCVDAEVYGATFIENSRMLAMDLDRSFPPMLAVAIGYPESSRIPQIQLRQRDLVTPGTPIPEWVVEALGGAGPEPASDKFLSFIEEELDPLIRQKYVHNPDTTLFCGDSYGGLFGLYALFRQSPVFDHYLLGSPGAVMEDDPVFDVEARQYEKGVSLQGRVYMAIGEYEKPGSGTPYATLGQNFYRLAVLLRERSYPDLEWTAEIIPGETHASVLPFNISRGFRWLFGQAGDPSLSSVPQL
jgi:predicted alpha/beta superfamily hydrolase